MKFESYFWLMIWTIRGLCLLSESPLIIHTCQSMVMKQSSSNGCLSLQHSIPFAVPRGCPKSDICMKCEKWFSAEVVWYQHWDAHFMLPQSHLIIIMYKTEVMKHPRSNGCLSLYHSIPVPMLRGCPKADILHEIWELLLTDMSWYGP